MALLLEDPVDLLSGPDDARSPSQWRTEIERRAIEVIEGRAELEDAELVHEQIAARLRSRPR